MNKYRFRVNLTWFDGVTTEFNNIKAKTLEEAEEKLKRFYKDNNCILYFTYSLYAMILDKK